MVNTETLHSTFASTQWGRTAEGLGAALGVSICVVDIESGVTISTSSQPEFCSAVLGLQSGSGLACVSRTERHLDAADPRLVHGVCEAGLQVAIAPVRLDGAVVCHVMVSGFSVGDSDRGRLRTRLEDAGLTEKGATAALEAVPVMDRKRSEAAVASVVTCAESLLRERSALDARAARGCEIAMLAEVARDLGPSGLMYGRLPEGSLRSLMRITGADVATVTLAAAPENAECPAIREGEAADDSVTGLMEQAAAHVRDTGRSFISTGADELGGKTSVVAVPLGEAEPVAGVLVLAKAGAAPLGSDDVRLAELFAETLGAMLSNAHDFIEANVKLVEMVQVDELARVLNATLDYERLGEVTVEVLQKMLTFEVGGFVIDGFGDKHGRVVHGVDLDRDELERLVADVWGSSVTSSVLDGVDVVGRPAFTEEDGGPLGSDWTILSHELRFHDVRAGELFVAASRPGAFTQDDERVLDALAAHLSIAMGNAALYGRLQADFERAMAALGAFADATERLEHGHTDRVMDFAVALGHELSLPLERIGLLRFAGLLHDLGKIGIAEEILVKPSALTHEEMELVRRHSDVGATIVEQVRVLEEITPIVRHHHEHWDGTGYPGGMSGEGIPLEARILAVADAFEAMTGRRHHRRRLSVGTARAEIERVSGTQFDPAVVEALARLLDRRALYGATGAYAWAADEQARPDLPV